MILIFGIRKYFIEITKEVNMEDNNVNNQRETLNKQYSNNIQKPTDR